MLMRRRLIGVLVLAMVGLVMGQVVGADSIADHVVISEVEISDSEWVELYNPTDSDVDMNGWYWCYYSSGRYWNSPTNRRALSGTIKAQRFYLLRIDGTVPNADWDTGYSAPPNTLDNTDGSVGIFPWDPVTKSNETAKSGRIDVVAWGSVSYVKEGTEATAPGSGESLQRRVNGTITENGYGPGWDSNDNSADFFIHSPDPQTSGADPLPPVPELSTLILLSIGLIALAGYVLLTKRRD